MTEAQASEPHNEARIHDFGIVGCHKRGYAEFVKTDDIHDTTLAEALLAAAGAFPDFLTSDEVEADDALYENRMEKRRAGQLCKF